MITSSSEQVLPRFPRELVSSTAFCTTSAIMERPNSFLRCATGTLPLRKPLSWTVSLTSSRRDWKSSPSSPWSITTFSSRFKPAVLVSVTCIFSCLNFQPHEVAL